jgi:predicted nucleic acid-binding Zn ribbon protein
MLKYSYRRNMERASKLIGQLRLPGETITAEELACTAWAGAVGKKIAEHTRAARMVRTRLIVEVEDHIWRRQLFSLSRHILVNLAQRIGSGVVEDLEFRIVPLQADLASLRRKEPQRAAASVPGLADDAALIADPVLRNIYRASRQKAGA